MIPGVFTVILEPKKFVFHYEVPRELVTFLKVTLDMCGDDYEGVQRRSDIAFAFWGEQRAFLQDCVGRISRDLKSNLEMLKHAR